MPKWVLLPREDGNEAWRGPHFVPHVTAALVILLSAGFKLRLDKSGMPNSYGQCLNLRHPRMKKGDAEEWVTVWTIAGVVEAHKRVKNSRENRAFSCVLSSRHGLKRYIAGIVARRKK